MASRQPSIFALLIINKAGGLIYQKNYGEGLNSNLSQNDYLILAGTFHGIHAIAARISPTGQSSGIEVIEAESFKMVCMQSPTGVKFVLVVSPSNTTADNALKAVYETYAEQLRDPFYAAEMPIRNENFDKKVAAIIKALS